MNWKWKYLIQQQHKPKNLVSVKRSVTNVLTLILTWWYAPSTDAILVDSSNSKSVPISRMQVFLDFDLSHVLILTTGPLYDGKRFWVVCRKKIETKIITYFNVLQKKNENAIWECGLLWEMSFQPGSYSISLSTMKWETRLPCSAPGKKASRMELWVADPSTPTTPAGSPGGPEIKQKKINVCYLGS